jgi:diketogulonate reductase-like aldo/keto reductase
MVLEAATVVPMVDQVEFHPYLQQPDLQAFCRKHQIQLEAWRPIMQGRITGVPELIELGKKYGKNPIQVALRWMIQRGVVTIPKSEKKEHIQSNADIFDFEIEAEDMAVIDGLDRHQRFGEDPDNFDFDF